MSRSRRVAIALALLAGPAAAGPVTMTRQAILDKVKGGWAGQVIGCTYGGPTEFNSPSTVIQDYQPIAWDERAIPFHFAKRPGTYDDVYMEITFMRVMEKEGWRARAASFAKAFAAAPYPLWHANQMARYNVLQGLKPPATGAWLHNPHADDIDFQIEADFAGLVAPGAPAAAADLCDRVGHVMNSGDGWYGGVYVATMYSLAFVESDVRKVVEGALAAVPAESPFAKTIRAAIAGHDACPSDWRDAWFRVEKALGEDVGCPEGVFSTFNIDARMNAAWIVLGLLYGNGDFGRTLEVATRCGDDSDCNPANAGGILGTILGYDRVPAAWKAGLSGVEASPFPYTDLSLEQVYKLTTDIALKVLMDSGAAIEGDRVTWTPRPVKAVRAEANFPGYRPREKRPLRLVLAAAPYEFAFDGVGFAVMGDAVKTGREERTPRLEVTIDGRVRETVSLPTAEHDRRPVVCFAYELPPGRHTVRLRVVEPDPAAHVRLDDVVTYDKAAAPAR